MASRFVRHCSFEARIRPLPERTQNILRDKHSQIEQAFKVFSQDVSPDAALTQLIRWEIIFNKFLMVLLNETPSLRHKQLYAQQIKTFARDFPHYFVGLL